MRGIRLICCGLMVLGSAAGCRTATRVTEVPRVDLTLSGAGNRGYLLGTPPPAGERRTTRQMLETNIEIPSFYTPKPGSRQVAPPTAPAPARPPASAAPAVRMAAPQAPPAGGPFDTYVVQKGDSLWSIAAQPGIYGRATEWRRLFDANRELLQGDPGRIREGMTLQIPRGDTGQTTFSDKGVSFKK